MKTQIGAFTVSMAALGFVASEGRSRNARIAVTAGAGAVGALGSYALARYVAQKRCEAVCEFLNSLQRGSSPEMNPQLQAAINWFSRIVGEMIGSGRDDDFLDWAAKKVLPYVTDES